MILDAATPARTMIAVAAALLLIGNTGWAIGTSDYVIEDAQYEIDNGNFEEAVNVLEQVIEAEGEDAELLNLMGFSLRNLDRDDEAMDFYNQALALDPDHQGALEYQGELYLKMGDQAAAEANLAKLAQLCPDGCEAYGVLQTAIERFKDGGVSSWVPPSRR